MDIYELFRRLLRLEKRVSCSCSKLQFFDTSGDFPETGTENVLYVNKETGVTSIWDGTAYIP